MPRRVLIVEPDEHYCRALFQIACQTGFHSTTRSGFAEARRDLATSHFDVVITSSKLGSFNGIHLVYLARQAHPDTTCIVYGDDPGVAIDAQHAGAFWERRAFLPFSTSHYLTAALPPTDRRDPRRVDRRIEFRGGRRASDRPELRAALTSLPRL